VRLCKIVKSRWSVVLRLELLAWPVRSDAMSCDGHAVSISRSYEVFWAIDLFFAIMLGTHEAFSVHSCIN
jgi:hypothetical protein